MITIPTYLLITILSNYLLLHSGQFRPVKIKFLIGYSEQFIIVYYKYENIIDLL